MINNQRQTTPSSSRDFLRNLSTQDFLNFGMRQIAYIRPVTIEDEQAFAVHAADGTPLSVLKDLKTAVVTVRQNDLEPVTLH